MPLIIHIDYLILLSTYLVSSRKKKEDMKHKQRVRQNHTTTNTIICLSVSVYLSIYLDYQSFDKQVDCPEKCFQSFLLAYDKKMDGMFLVMHSPRNNDDSHVLISIKGICMLMVVKGYCTFFSTSCIIGS
jgi:hypothetical protein